MGELWPDRDFCLIREWTKKYEEIISFKGRRAKGLDFKEKGEFVVVLGPYEKSDRWDDERLVKRLQDLESQGLSGKDIIKTLSSESGRKKNEIYSLREEFKKRRS